MEEKTGIVAKSRLKRNHPTTGVKVASFKTTKQGKVFPPDVSAVPEEKEGAHQINAGIRKWRQKNLPSKVRIDVTHTITLMPVYLFFFNGDILHIS